MNYSDLKGFFESKTDALTLSQLIHEEVVEYRYNLSNRKSVSITLNYIENEHMTINMFHFKKICSTYLDGFLDEYRVYYIVDAIQLSENFEFENENVADLFSLITDPEVNGQINQEVVRKLLISAT